MVGAAGGLHKFMGRDRPRITDSGGFQIFSLKPRGELAMPGEAGRDAANVDGDVDDGECDDGEHVSVRVCGNERELERGRTR